VMLAVAASLAGTQLKTFGAAMTAGNLLLLTWGILRHGGRTKRALLSTGTATGLAIGLPWLLRGMFISGCLIYPVSPLCFPTLSWAVPAADLNDLLGAIRSLNGAIGAASFDILDDVKRNRTVQLTVLVVCLGTVLAAVRARRLSPESLRWGGVALLFQAIALAYWFSFAPSPPFIVQTLVCVMAIVIGTAASGIRLSATWRAGTPFVLLAFFLFSGIRTGIRTYPEAINWERWPIIPETELTEHRLPSGMTLYRNRFQQCFATEKIPCGFPRNNAIDGTHSSLGRYHFRSTGGLTARGGDTARPPTAEKSDKF